MNEVHAHNHARLLLYALISSHEHASLIDVELIIFIIQMDRLPAELLPKIASIIAMYINLHRAIIVLTGTLHTYCVTLLIGRSNKRKRIDVGDYERHKIREISLHKIVFDSNLACIENTCMDRRSFHALCDMLQSTKRLTRTKNMCVEEMVAIFLHICAHHAKNRVIKR